MFGEKSLSWNIINYKLLTKKELPENDNRDILRIII